MNIIWAVIFFLLLSLGITYVSWHIWQILPIGILAKWVVVSLLLACIVCFFTNFFVGLDHYPMAVSKFLYELGNSSIFITLYLAMVFIILDIGRIVHLIPKSFMFGSRLGTASILILVVAIFIYGYFNYERKERVQLNVETSKPLKRPLRVVMMSDLHLGYHNTRADFHKWVSDIMAENADLILIAGDVIDGSIRALLEQDMATEFRRLKVPIYACLGNHEYYSGRKEAIQFYKDAGIHLLVDETEEVELRGDTILLIGRDDRVNENRKSVKELLSGFSNNRYVILLDHQPYHLEEAEQAGVDFQLSGHTHYGQVWPISWIEEAIYEKAFGALKKGDTQYYISSGIGIWGAKFRIGTRSEYVVADIRPVSEEHQSQSKASL